METLLDTAGSYSITVTIAVDPDPEGYFVVKEIVEPLYWLVIVVVERPDAPEDLETLLEAAGSYSMTVTTEEVPEGYCVVSEVVEPL